MSNVPPQCQVHLCIADVFRELDKGSQTRCEPEGSDGPAEVWHMNELLRKQFRDVLAPKPKIEPTDHPTDLPPAARVVEQPRPEAPALVDAPAIVHGPSHIEKAHTELTGILLGQVAAVKAVKEAEIAAKEQEYFEKTTEDERAADADRAAKVGRKAAEQALGIMPQSEIETLSLEDTADISALFEWAPSKVSELDPSAFQETDTSDYADRAQMARSLSQRLSNVDPAGFDRHIRMREGRRGLQPLP